MQVLEDLFGDLELEKEYEVICFLGQGSFGKVFKVLEKKSNKFYAVKVKNNVKKFQFLIWIINPKPILFNHQTNFQNKLQKGLQQKRPKRSLSHPNRTGNSHSKIVKSPEYREILQDSARLWAHIYFHGVPGGGQSKAVRFGKSKGQRLLKRWGSEQDYEQDCRSHTISAFSQYNSARCETRLFEFLFGIIKGRGDAK